VSSDFGLTEPKSDTSVPDPVLKLIGDWSHATSERADRTFACVVADMTWMLPVVSPPSVDNLVSYAKQAQ
jgi:hypothetical protein